MRSAAFAFENPSVAMCNASMIAGAAMVSTAGTICHKREVSARDDVRGFFGAGEGLQVLDGVGGSAGR